MKTPRTNTQEVLLTLIEKGTVSIFDFPYLSGFRTRVSELCNKYKLKLKHEQKKGINKFGNTYTFVEHILIDKTEALTLYSELTNG